MFSEAGRSYDKTRVVSPYRTKQRWRYYQLDPVQSNKKIAKQYQTLQTNLRAKQDSYILRYAKDITLNTDYTPCIDTVKQTSPRQIIPKAPFARIIGDVRDEDYSVPLKDNCNHRCAQANNIPISKDKPLVQGQGASPQSNHETLMLMRNEDNKSSLTTIQPINASQKLGISNLQSTDHSLINNISKIIIKPITEHIRQKPLRGVSFDSSVGHRYLKEVQDSDKNPQFYDIQKSNQSMVLRSFKQHKAHLKFGQFRDSVATRQDRADPYWNLSIDTSNCQIGKKDMSYDFNMHSNRQINEVKSKYPFRQNMNLYMLPTKAKLIQN